MSYHNEKLGNVLREYTRFRRNWYSTKMEGSSSGNELLWYVLLKYDVSLDTVEFSDPEFEIIMCDSLIRATGCTAEQAMGLVDAEMSPTYVGKFCGDNGISLLPKCTCGASKTEFKDYHSSWCDAAKFCEGCSGCVKPCGRNS